MKVSAAIINAQAGTNFNFSDALKDSVLDYTYYSLEEPKCTLEIYWVPSASQELLSYTLNQPNSVVVVCLDWRNPNEWTTKLEPKSENLVIAVTHFTDAGRLLDSQVAFLQARLRLCALEANAGLYFCAPDLDWRLILSSEAGASISKAEPRLVDHLVIPSGWDTFDKIQATNPHLDLEAAKTGLPKARLPAPEMGICPEEVKLADYDAIVGKAASQGRKLVTEAPKFDFKHAVSEQQALDSFFNYLEHKAGEASS